MERDKILEKVRLCLNLTQSPNEAEANTAMLKAQELLQKYNLSMAEVEGLDMGTKDGNMVMEQEVFMGAYGKKGKGWKVNLAHVIARFNFCTMIYTKCNIVFIGRKIDVEVVKEMYVWMVEQGERLAWDSVRSSKPKEMSTIKYKNSFLYGFGDGVNVQLGENWNRLYKSEEMSNALVVVTKEQISEYMSQAHPRLIKSNDNYRANGNAYGSGVRAGKSASLARTKEVTGRLNMLEMEGVR